MIIICPSGDPSDEGRREDNRKSGRKKGEMRPLGGSSRVKCIHCGAYPKKK